MELSVSSFFAEYMIHPFSPELSQKDRVTATIASIVVGILTLGIAHVVCSALRSRQIRHLRQAQKEKGIALSRFVGPVILPSPNEMVGVPPCGRLSFKTMGNAIQRSFINPIFSQPLPRASQVIVPLSDGRKVRWKSLTEQEKIAIYNQKAPPHQQIRFTSWGKNHVDQLLMLGGQAPFLPSDPREIYGSDHAARMAIFTSIFAYLYAKYHPSIGSLTEDEVALAQFIGAGCESGRLTEGGSLYAEDSARRTIQALESLEVKDRWVHHLAHVAITQRNDHPTDDKSLMAKLVQNADCVEAGRFGPYRPPLDILTFHSSQRYLDIFQELSRIAETTGGKLKGGLTFDDFENELDVIRWEMECCVKQTKEKSFRARASTSGDDYYSRILSSITPEDYPLLSKILGSMGVKKGSHGGIWQQRQHDSAAILGDISNWMARGLDTVPMTALNRFAQALESISTSEERDFALRSISSEIDARNEAQQKFDALLALPKEENIEKVVQAFASLPYLLREQYRRAMEAYFPLVSDRLQNQMVRTIMILEMGYKELCGILDEIDVSSPLEQARDLMLWAKRILEMDKTVPYKQRDPRMQTACALALERAAILFHDNEDIEQAKEALSLARTRISCEAPHPLLRLWNAEAPLAEDGSVYTLASDCYGVRKRRLRVCERVIDGVPYREISFELTTAAREDLEKTLSLVDPLKKSIIPAQYLRKAKGKNAYTALQSMGMGHDVKVETGEGIEVCVGCEERYWNQYKLVRVRVRKGVALDEVQKALSSIGLPTVLMNSRPQDQYLEALSRILSFRFPSLMPPGGLSKDARRVYNQLPPDSRAIVDEDLRNMKEAFVSPEAVELVRTGIEREAWSLGARALGTFISAPDIGTTAQVLVNVLRKGFLSSEERFQRGILGLGCVPTLNYEAGSGNQVFTRILTKDQFAGHYPLSNFPVAGAIFFILDLRAMERMPYSYLHDRAGVRNPHYFKQVFPAQKQKPIMAFRGEERALERPGFRRLIAEQEKTPHPLNETMFDLTLGTQYIQLILVQDAKDREIILQVLKAADIFDINGMPVEEAIRVSSQLFPALIPHWDEEPPLLEQSRNVCKYVYTGST